MGPQGVAGAGSSTPGPAGPPGPGMAIGGLNTQVQFNDNGVLGGNAALTFDKTLGFTAGNSFSGSYQWMGGYTGGLDFHTRQTYGVARGSNITAISGGVGQVCRILVSGAGAGGISLPAGIVWAQGSPAWGNNNSILVTFFFDGATWRGVTLGYNS